MMYGQNGGGLRIYSPMSSLWSTLAPNFTSDSEVKWSL